MVLKTIGCPSSVGLLAGFCWTESRSTLYLLFPGAWGGGACIQMTGAYEVTMSFLTASLLGFSDMVSVVACHARDLGSNPVVPKSLFLLGITIAVIS